MLYHESVFLLKLQRKNIIIVQNQLMSISPNITMFKFDNIFKIHFFTPDIRNSQYDFFKQVV